MLKLYENPNMIVNAEDLSNTHKNVLILLKTQHINAQNHFFKETKIFYKPKYDPRKINVLTLA